MGASRPKRGRDVTRLDVAEDWWQEVEEVISDVALLERTDDRTLKVLIELAVASLETKQPVFPNPLDTPVLWTKFMVAVQGAREDAKKAKEELKSNIPDMPGL